MINSPNHPMPNPTSAPRRSNEQARFLAAKAVRDLHGLYLVVWIVWIHVVVFVLLIAYRLRSYSSRQSYTSVAGIGFEHMFSWWSSFNLDLRLKF